MSGKYDWKRKIIFGSRGDDVLAGGSGRDVIFGRAGDDVLTGGAGDDFLFGGRGADALDGGAGNDRIFAGGGDDRGIYRLSDNLDAMDLYGGGSGKDTLQLALNLEQALDPAVQADLAAYSNFLATQAAPEDGDEDEEGEDDDDDGAGFAFTAFDLEARSFGALSVSVEGVTSGDATVRPGTAGDDTLIGTDGSDLQFGGAGNDYIEGGDGDDVLDGGGGDDHIIGGPGNDTVDYGSTLGGVDVNLTDGVASGPEIGNDVLIGIRNVIGSFGNDKIVGDGGGNWLRGGLGDDYLAGLGGSDTLIGAAGADTYAIAAGDGMDTIDERPIASIDPESDTLRFDGLAATDLNLWRRGDDLIVDIGFDQRVEVLDQYPGTIADYGIEKVQVGFGTPDVHTYDFWSDIQIGDDDVDILTGNAGGNLLFGNGGDDVLDGRGGNDTLIGGTGVDTYVFRALGSWDTVLDTADGGTLRFDGIGITDLMLSRGGDDLVVDYGAGDRVTVQSQYPGSGYGIDKIEIAGVVYGHQVGTNSPDTLTVGASPELLFGIGGNDTFFGGAGIYVFHGGDGTDTVDYRFSTTPVDVGLAAGSGSGASTLISIENVIGSDRDDRMSGDDKSNLLDGRAGEDTALYSSTELGVVVDLASDTAAGPEIATDTLMNFENVVGGSGNDNIAGDEGHNALFGGLGNDILDGGGLGDDILNGGAGIDTASYATATFDLIVDLAGHTATSARVIPSEIGTDELFDIENVIGGWGDDTIYGDALSNVLDGGPGNDTVGYARTTRGVDVNLAAGVATGIEIGTDTLIDMETVAGGSGDDRLAGDGGVNWLSGGGGKDELVGSAGNDFLFGDAGTDTVDYSSAESGVVVDLGEGTATGPEIGTDTLRDIENAIGGAGEDTIRGGDGTNILDGAGGNDILNGGAGEDALLGGLGNDTLTGGGGKDELIGGAGLDTAVFSGGWRDYAVAYAKDGRVTVTDTVTGRDDTDYLSDVELAQFADGTVFIDGTNNAPVTADDTLAAAEDRTLRIDPQTLLLNDAGFDGDSFQVTAVGNAVNGTATLEKGTLFFTPDADFSGTASFDYTVVDARKGASTATVTVDVAPVADAPTLTLFDATVDQNLSDPVTGPEFQVNTHTAHTQITPSVTALAGGGFVVIWESVRQRYDGSWGDIYGQLYDAGGTAIGDEFPINTYAVGSQALPTVAALADGGFVAIWSSDLQDGSSRGVFGQRFDGKGKEVGDEFQVNTFTTNRQDPYSVTGLPDGGFVVVWNSWHQDGSSVGVYGQLYDKYGATVGPEFRANTTTHSYQGMPAVAPISDVGFVVVWQSAEQDGSGYGIYGQRYDTAGDRVGQEFPVNTTTYSWQINPAVAALEDDGFVVTWQSYGQDGHRYGIFGQRFKANGELDGPEFQVNSFTYDNQTLPSVTGLADGGFVVTWASQVQDGSGDGIYGQRYDAAGTPVGDEFQISVYVSSDQDLPSVTALTGGGFVVTWQSHAQDGDLGGIYSRTFDVPGPTVAALDITAALTDADGSEVLGDITITIAADAPDGGSNDTLLGGAGSDLYVFATGDGFDRVHDVGLSPDIDTLRFTGLQASELNFRRFGDHIWSPGNNMRIDYGITTQGTFGASVDVDLQFESGNGIERIELGGKAYSLGDPLLGAAGNDPLFGDVDSHDTFAGTAGDDLLYGGRSNAYVNTVTYESTTQGVIVNLADGIATGPEIGTDTLVSIRYVIGGSGSDVITGDADLNGLTGSGGADVLDGGLGDDILDGGAGNDTYVVDSNDDQVIELPGGGIDTVEAHVSRPRFLENDVENLSLYGTADEGWGNDDNVIAGNASLSNGLFGRGGDDRLVGGPFTDHMFGGADDDELIGGEGGDELLGGEGDDTFIFETNHGQDTVIETGSPVDKDTLRFENYGQVAAFKSGLDWVFQNGLDEVTVVDQFHPALPPGTGIEAFVVDGETIDLTFERPIVDLARDGALLQFGGGGGDIMLALGSAYMFGGSGDDTLYGDNGSNILIGGSDNDRLEGGERPDTYVFGPMTVSTRSMMSASVGTWIRSASTMPRRATSASAAPAAT